MDVSNTLCKIYNISPFILFKEDSEEVIMLLNYMIDKSLDHKATTPSSAEQKEERIYVNEKTATGGWY